MFKNYFKIAWRNLFRSKIYSFINISGIAIGLAAFWLIALYIADELSFDRYHKNAGRIVRVAQHASWEGNNISQASTSAPFAAALKAEYPEIQQATRIVPEGDGVISHHDKSIKVADIFFADANVFDVFSYSFLAGDSKTALSKPEAIVLTESLARKFFSNPEDAINQTIYFENNYPNTVTGVMKDVPENSHLRFSALRSLPFNYTGGWQNFNNYTYLLLTPGTSHKKLEAKLPTFAAKTIQKMMGVSDYRMELQPLTSIHLHSNLQGEMGANGSMGRIYIFIAIAALILIIAVINYMNLSTARSSTRIREVGVRKVIGSGRGQLVGMFITEAMVMIVIAAFVSFFLVTVMLPYFNELADKNLTIWRFGVYTTLVTLTGFAVLIGILSGSYPAFFLSHFKTIPALKGQLGNLSNNILFRKSLVVFQFVITVAMIAGSLIIYKQLEYSDKKDLGFNKEQVLTFHIHDRAVRSQVAAIKSKLLQNPLIQGVAAAGNPIGNNDLGSHGFVFEKADGSFASTTKLVQELMTDADYIPTLDIKLLMGRNFSTAIESDKYGSALINETLLKELGWTDPVGKRMRFKYDDKGSLGERTVIGVVKDFHTYSLQHKVEPLVMLMPPAVSMEDNLYVKINTLKTKESLGFLETVYRQFDKNNPLEFNFLDQNFTRQYAAEKKQGKILIVFTILTIFIACLGLFGLVTFTGAQRTKEIGIRKVLGASVTSIVTALTKDLIKLVLIAFVIALPVVWFTMNKWLQEFEYRMTISWWIFGASGLTAIVMAILTVSVQAIKAAIANPVKSLRSE
ncbi:MAG: ABC transporter permease [Chitinophagaceae bacterium]|nr:ABC transporter permease [Chitinophagaceae bacterium]